jgi:glucan 1,3-beta-glucosidase
MPPRSEHQGHRRLHLPRAAIVLALAAGVVALLGGLLQRNRALPLPDSGSASQAPLPCVSYAPFRRAGASPFDAALIVPPAQIEADLRLLAGVTRCVRTYGLDHGLSAVPAIARRLGLRVRLGVWIGRDGAANDDQLRRGLALARDHADVVELLIVGNEVLLRRELSPAALAALLARARRESPVPVTYADVWEFWLRHGPVLRPHVDRIAAHILPYWEDEPVGIDQAVTHVHAIAQRLQSALAPLPVWVAETGWPAAGRQRGPARPGRAEQALFVRALLARERTDALGFNLIEGFDQPWKRDLEGAMGGHWGLFDAQGRQRVPLHGPLEADPQVQAPLKAAGLAGLFSLAWAAMATARGARRRTPASPTAGPVQTTVAVPRADQPVPLLRLVVGCLGAIALATLATLQWQWLQLWCRTPWEWSAAAAITGIALACALLEWPRLAERLACPARPHARAGLRGAWHPRATQVVRERSAAAAPDRSPWPARWRATALFALLFVMAWLSLQLLFDARYRPLVWPILPLPAAMLLALSLMGERLAVDAREERLLAAVGAAASLAVVAHEGLANGQALVAAATCLASAAVAWPHRAGRREEERGRTSTSAESSQPNDAGPVA